MRQSGQAYDDQAYDDRAYDDRGYDDGFAIPRPNAGFRVPRHRAGMDRTTRNMILVAAGIALVIVLAVAVQAMLRPHGLPVVAAQSGPWRVKPADPGGMRVEGTGNAIFNGTRPVTQDQVMPGPETPDLAALARDVRPAASPAAPAAPATSAPAAPPPQTQAQGLSLPLTPRGVEAVAAMPLPPQLAPPPQAATTVRSATAPPLSVTPQPATAVQATAIAQAALAPQTSPATPVIPTPRATAALPVPPAPVAPARVAAAAPPPAVGSALSSAIGTAPPQAASGQLAAAQTALAQAAAGSAVVQLAALPTEAGARAEWQLLSRRMPGLLGGRAPLVSKAVVNGHTWWRLRTGGFASLGAARDFCAQVKAQGGACAAESP